MRSLFVAAFFLVAAPVQAQVVPAITLSPDEAVTVRIEGEVAAAGPREVARWTPFDLHVARQLAGMTPPDAPVPEASPLRGGPAPDPIPADQVRIRFLSIAGRHALLVVENGRGLALSYRATMTRDGRERHTDVCVVLPHLPSYEHWPHPIERIVLSDFRFIPWQQGRAPTCA